MGEVPESLDAVVLIDMQPEYLCWLAPGRAEQLIKYQREVLAHTRRKSLPVLAVEYHTLSPTVSELGFAAGKLHRVPKHRSDSFRGSTLYSSLQRLGAQNVLCSGVYTSDCVRRTLTSKHKHELRLFTSAQLTADLPCLEAFGGSLGVDLLVPYQDIFGLTPGRGSRQNTYLSPRHRRRLH
jgi:nicotinamidase-related amidase